MKGYALSIILIGLASLMLYGVINNGNIFSTIGFQTLSLSSANYISNDPNFNYPAWVLTVVQNGKGEHAVGIFTPSEIIDTNDGVQSANNVKIETKIEKMNAKYIIHRTHEKLKKMNYEKRNLPLGVGAGSFEDDCKNRNGYYGFYKQPNSWNYWCFWTSDVGEFGTIEPSFIEFRSLITTTTDKGTYTCTISNTDVTSCQYKPYMAVYWAGNLVSGDIIPNPEDRGIMALYLGSYGWRSVSKEKYTEWKTYHDLGGMFSCLQTEEGKDDPAICVNEYNRRSDNAMQWKFLTSEVGRAQLYGDVNNGQVKLRLPKNIQFPVLTIHLNKNYITTVSISQPVGIPKIVKIETQEFTTGETGHIQVKIQNIGNDDGSFKVYADCEDPFSQVGGYRSIYLHPSEYGWVDIPITADVGSDMTRKCTVHVYDVTNPDNKDSGYVYVTAKPIIVCNDGEMRCNGKIIEKCENNQWKAYKTCEYECNMYGGTATCSATPPTECGKWDIGCLIRRWMEKHVYNPLGKLLFILIIIFIIYVVLNLLR